MNLCYVHCDWIFLHFFLKRDVNVGLDDGEWHHVCFTWSGRNGDYEFYKDGVSVARGTGMNVGGKIRSGGTTVIWKNQNEVGGGFVASLAFLGDVTEVNVWGTVLSESDFVAQARNFHVTQGSENWWSQFKLGVHGGVLISWGNYSASFKAKNWHTTMISVLNLDRILKWQDHYRNVSSYANSTYLRKMIN